MKRWQFLWKGKCICFVLTFPVAWDALKGHLGLQVELNHICLKRYVEFPSSRTYEWNLIWRQSFANEFRSDKMRVHSIPKLPIGTVFTMKEKQLHSQQQPSLKGQRRILCHPKEPNLRISPLHKGQRLHCFSFFVVQIIAICDSGPQKVILDQPNQQTCDLSCLVGKRKKVGLWITVNSS